MSAPHCQVLIAPVPESVSRSIRTSSAGNRKRLLCAARSCCSRSSRVVHRMGSTLLILKGSMIVLTAMRLLNSPPHWQALLGSLQVEQHKIELGSELQ